MKYLLAILLPALAFAETRTPISPGCYVSFQTMQCQENEPGTFYWNDYGWLENEHIYGAPVAALINQAVEARALLDDWIEYAEAKEKRAKFLRGRLKTMSRRCR